MQPHKIASREDWLAARKWLLGKERELTHLRDKLNAERRALPWVPLHPPHCWLTKLRLPSSASPLRTRP